MPSVRYRTVFSECRRYRYVWTHQWDLTIPSAMFVCLNPHEADENNSDDITSKCCTLARHWNLGGITMLNLFAYKTTVASVLSEISDPVGVNNDKWLKKMANTTDMIIAAWGNHIDLAGRDTHVCEILKYLYVIGDQGPIHPLQVSGLPELKIWQI